MNNSNVLNHQCRMRMVRIVLLALTTMMMATAALAAAPIVDHTWIWRADHGSGVGWNTNPSAIGLVVNGRSEEHTSELQSLRHLVCRLLLEKKKKNKRTR